MHITTGTLPGRDGFQVGYDLFLPACSSSGFCAGLLLLHGFAGKRAHLAGHAARLARTGCVVLLPDMSSLFYGPREAAQLRNVYALADHAEWLISQRCADGRQLVDPTRLVLGGHSAGGAVAFEACSELDRRGGAARAAACVLLDGVPWPRTTREAGGFPLERTLVVSLRSEPSAWNMYGEVRKALAAAVRGSSSCHLDERLIDVKILGSKHADAIDPKTSQCLQRTLGLLGPVAAWEAYAELIVAIGSDACAAGQLTSVAVLMNFREKVDAMSERGAVTVTRGSF